MSEHFIFDKLSDKENRLKIALQVSKIGFSHSDALSLEVLVLLVVAVRCHIARSHGCKLEFSRSGRVKRRRKRTRQLSSAVFNLTRARFSSEKS